MSPHLRQLRYGLLGLRLQRVGGSVGRLRLGGVIRRLHLAGSRCAAIVARYGQRHLCGGFLLLLPIHTSLRLLRCLLLGQRQRLRLLRLLRQRHILGATRFSNFR
jgi:hypothetical protein